MSVKLSVLSVPPSFVLLFCIVVFFFHFTPFLDLLPAGVWHPFFPLVGFLHYHAFLTLCSFLQPILSSCSSLYKTENLFFSSCWNTSMLILLYFTLFVSIFFSFSLASLIFTFASIIWWSELKSAHSVLKWTSPLLIDHVVVYSTVFPSGDSKVVLWMFLCGKRLPPITNSSASQNTTSFCPCAFISPLLCFLIVISLFYCFLQFSLRPRRWCNGS